MAQWTAELTATLRSRYGFEIRCARALAGGYDQWADSWRLDTDRGSLVVRVDRSLPLPTAAWLERVTARAADRGLPCLRSLPTLDGASAVPIDGATITVRPFAEGVAIDRDNAAQVEAAGTMLGLLHHALTGEADDRPEPSPWAACQWPGEHDPPQLHDRTLDRWDHAFAAGAGSSFATGVVHGDFWAGNLLWDDDRITAVIDWSEARVDVLARELAWATWEFGHDSDSRLLDAERARTFLRGYRAVAGPWEAGLEDVFVALMRVELRLNARYTLTDPGDREYNAALRRAFVALRGRSAAELLDGL